MATDETRALTAGRLETGRVLIGRAVVCEASVLASIELHESLHLDVGRLDGLPARFLAVTSVGISESLALKSAPSALALMNGVAPIATMVLGLLALWALPWLRRRAPPVVIDFVAWWAIFGVAYIGLQTMLTAAPIELRGNGADFAAVIGGYFGVASSWRTAISIVGVVLFILSGVWLRRAVRDPEDQTEARASWGARLRHLAAWQIALGGLLSATLIVMAVRSALWLGRGDASGIALLFRVTWVWAGLMVVMVDWQHPAARKILHRWIIPGIAASIGLWILGFVMNVADFTVIAIMLVLPLLTTAYVRQLVSPPKIRPHTHF